MRLVNSAPDSIELRGRDPVRSPIWVGLGLLLGPTLLSLLGPAAFTATHLAGVTTLLALAGGLIALGWPRARWVRIRDITSRTGTELGGTIATSEDGERPLGHDLTVKLIAVPTEGSSGNALYGVGLVLPASEAPRHLASGTPSASSVILLIAREDPSDTLADLARLRARLPLKVVGGWGLPKDAPWADTPAPDRHGNVQTAPWDDRAARRPVALALIVGGVAIGVAMLMEIRGRLELGDAPAPLSLVLPFVALTLLGVVTLALVTHGVRLVSDPTPASARSPSDLSCERRIFGVAYSERRIRKTDVRGVYPVSPSGHHARHVLFDTPDGAVAFPCDDVLASKLAAEFHRERATAAGR